MRPDKGYILCDYEAVNIFGPVSCENGYLKGTSDYDRGWKSLAHSDKMAARQPCPNCNGQGQIKNDEDKWWTFGILGE